MISAPCRSSPEVHGTREPAGAVLVLVEAHRLEDGSHALEMATLLLQRRHESSETTSISP